MRIPALPHLDLEAARIDFRHAAHHDMYRAVCGGGVAYEPEVLAALICVLARNDRSRLVNVGANVGYFTFVSKKLFRDRVDVHAYEPMPALYQCLLDGRRNNCVDVRVSEIALADYEGTAKFHLSDHSDTSNSLNPGFRPSRAVIDVAVSTLDRQFGLTHDDDRQTVLLIDTESTEPAVLRGGRALIERTQPTIICEVLAGRTEADLAEFFGEIDYSPYALTGQGIERRDAIIGDATYQHRDWLFLPQGQSPPSNDCVVETLQRLQTRTLLRARFDQITGGRPSREILTTVRQRIGRLSTRVRQPRHQPRT